MTSPLQISHEQTMSQRGGTTNSKFLLDIIRQVRVCYVLKLLPRRSEQRVPNLPSSVCLYLYLFVCLSVSLFLFVCLVLSFSVSLSLCVCFCYYLSLSLSLCVSASVTISLFLSLSLSLSLSLLYISHPIETKYMINLVSRTLKS